jgi:putative endonuclease
MSNCWYVYILECSDNTFYTGITTDLERRLEQHNDGTGAVYTRIRRPVLLRASFKVDNRSLVLREEYRIKQLTKKQKIELINNLNK